MCVSPLYIISHLFFNESLSSSFGFKVSNSITEENAPVCPPTSDRKENAPWIYNPNHRSSISRQRAALPIFKKRREILYVVESTRRDIMRNTYFFSFFKIAAKHKSNDRGCGKSTQVPQYLHEQVGVRDRE